MSYITVVKPVSSFCGKSFSLSPDGKIEKSLRASAPARSMARTERCENLDQLAQIINSLSEGEAIILGYVPEAIGSVAFHLWSMTQIRERFQESGELTEGFTNTVEREHLIIRNNGELYLPRKKFLFKRAPFVCIDRDVDENAPENIKEVQALSNSQFLRILCEELGDDVSNSFNGADFLPVASSSGQVFKEDGTPYVSDPSAHLFFKVDNPDDIDRFGAAIFAQAMANGFSYNKEINRKDNVNAFRKQTIFDPSVFTSGRLFFESSPKVGYGLVIKKNDCKVVEWAGACVNTEAVRDPNGEIIEKLRQHNIEFHTGRIGSHFSSEGLHPDLVVETQDHGPMSIAQYSRSCLGKIRCQTPFRNSSSWAAYLNTHDDGEPYMWDEGSRTKYRLVKDDQDLIALYRDAIRVTELATEGNMNMTACEYEMAQLAHECESVSCDVVTVLPELSDDEEANLLALVEHEESNVIPLHEQFNVSKISPPPSFKPTIKLFNGHDLKGSDLRTPKDMIIWGGGVLVKGGLTMFGGAPKVGKSDLLLKMLMAAACGANFLNHEFSNPQTVLWFQAELMPEFLNARYEESISCFPEHLHDQIRENLIITENGARQLNGYDNFEYKKIIEQVNPDIVAVDPLRNLISLGNESDASEMITALTSIKETATKINPDISVIVVHHLRKGSNGKIPDPFDLFSGSGALRGYYDSGIVMLPDEDMTNVRHLHWEIRNGKPIESMEVTREDSGDWLLNGGLVASAMEITNAKPAKGIEQTYRDLVIDLLKCDGHINGNNTISWVTVKNRLSLVIDNMNMKISNRTMDKYMKEMPEIISVRNGIGLAIYYDGSKRGSRY